MQRPEKGLEGAHFNAVGRLMGLSSTGPVKGSNSYRSYRHRARRRLTVAAGLAVVASGGLYAAVANWGLPMIEWGAQPIGSGAILAGVAVLGGAIHAGITLSDPPSRAAYDLRVIFQSRADAERAARACQ